MKKHEAVIEFVVKLRIRHSIDAVQYFMEFERFVFRQFL
jgi:hypothetical protein